MMWRSMLPAWGKNIENCCNGSLELHHERATRGHKSSAHAWEKLVGAPGKDDMLENVATTSLVQSRTCQRRGWLWQHVLWVSARLHAAVLIAGGFLDGEQFVGIC